MSKKYLLINESLQKTFGTVSFNGKFTFQLADDIDEKTWNRVGIIPLQVGEREAILEGDQFYYLNSRLPQNLRLSSTEDKIEYIDHTGLRVASDSFVLKRETGSNRALA